MYNLIFFAGNPSLTDDCTKFLVCFTKLEYLSLSGTNIQVTAIAIGLLNRIWSNGRGDFSGVKKYYRVGYVLLT